MRLACTRERKDTIQDPKEDMNMATQSSVTVTKEGHPKEGLQEELQVHSGRKQLAIKTISDRVTPAQEEEEGIEKH